MKKNVAENVRTMLELIMFEKGKDLFGVHQKATSEHFSLDSYLGTGQVSRFLFKMESDSLTPYICEGDVLVIDRAKKPKHGDYILGAMNGVFVCRRLEVIGETKQLCSRSGRETLGPDDEFLIFGVVVSFARNLEVIR